MCRRKASIESKSAEINKRLFGEDTLAGSHRPPRHIDRMRMNGRFFFGGGVNHLASIRWAYFAAGYETSALFSPRYSCLATYVQKASEEEKRIQIDQNMDTNRVEPYAFRIS